MAVLYYEEPDLIKRGWSLKGIKLYIGKPDRILGGKNCYNQSRVTAADKFLKSSNNEHLKGIK